LGQLECYAALVVLLAGRVEIEIGDQDPAAVSGSEIEQCRALDGVVPDFHSPAVFEHEKSGWQRRIGVDRWWIRLDAFWNMGRSSLLGGRHVRALSLPTPIENRGTALIVSVILGCVLGLALVGSVSGVSRVIWYRDGIPDWTGGGRIIAIAMAVAVSVSLVTIVTIVAIVAVVSIMDAVIRDESRTRDGCVASWSDRCHAGGKAVDRTPSKTGRGHGRRNSIHLGLGRHSEKQRNRQGAKKRDGG
jgi:hypothetical protein